MNALFCLAIPEGFGQPVQILAIVGGAALGALGSGLLAQGLTRWMTMKALPRLPTMIVRGLGGVVLGLLTAMLVWQGGSWGPGGPGGTGNPDGGTGTDKTEADKDAGKVADQAKDKDKAPTPDVPTPPEGVLRLEVLTDEAIRTLDGPQAVQEHRYYRLEDDKDAKELRTLDDLRQLIHKRVGDKPPLQRLDVVTRADSPDKSAARVEQVRQLASDFSLKVEFPPR